MKKIFSAIFVALIAVIFVGCGEKKEAVDTINNHIIEVRNNLYAGSDENFFATFCTGDREDPYGLDGVINEKIPFGIVTFSRVNNSSLNNTEYNFTIIINGEETSGILEKSPYDNTYSADIGKKVDDNAEISLRLTADGKEFNQVLFNESKNFAVTKEDAINIAGEELKDAIVSMNKEDGSPEAMVKILKDCSGETNRYFWYVGIVSSNGKTAGVLIDANTGDIISKKL